MPRLVSMGLLAQSDADGLLAELAEMRGNPLRFVQCPPVWEVLATKK